MHKKSIVYKLCVDLETTAIQGSESCTAIRNAVNQFNDKISTLMKELGLHRQSSFPITISEKNGGYAIYSKFIATYDVLNIMLLVDIRCGDHPSKPNLARKSKIRVSNLSRSNNAKLIDDIHVEDTYLTKIHSSDIVYYIGKGDNYSNPIQDEDDASLVVYNRVKKFLSSRCTSYADALLAKYPKDLVSIASEYVSYIDDLEINDDSNNLTDSNLFVHELRDQYIHYGIELGILEDSEEFDEICNILQIKYLY